MERRTIPLVARLLAGAALCAVLMPGLARAQDADAPDGVQSQSKLIRELDAISAAQEDVLREIAVRREPSRVLGVARAGIVIAAGRMAIKIGGHAGDLSMLRGSFRLP